MVENTISCDIGDAVPEFSIAVVSIRMIDGFVATSDNDRSEAELQLWRDAVANAELSRLVGALVKIVKLTVLATVFSQEDVNNMLHIPDAKCRFETFMAAVELITKDLVEVTIVYIVVDTLLIAPFKKDGVEVWLNEAKVAFPGVGNYLGLATTSWGRDKGVDRSSANHTRYR